ncbi:nuclear pore complex protein NUP50A-like [Vigna unguiculata]|uniref:E3 SUMO-protein ligase RanBP2 n=1 Tax=Vigna unguiculata TaxID=3917 RepID=A0A4D6N8T3_VIGUN|nr:nuclear pore complex protein NUP50A-like [Vigna unguiculata]XP_027928302.1 nuclear pore complex protein NUP50A-like [Vigna unguiculata]QCE08939.1 E3 SUMO-protein ligase RanBP2 [Vigna unguiculata]
MGDADNALPPSKKRAAGRELTRDTPVDEEEDSPELETGTFKRASDDVLATRRIVKVRRQQTSSAPSANPFAGIRLVAPTEPSANPAATTEVQSTGENTGTDDSKSSDGIAKDSEKAEDGETKRSESKTNETEDKPIEDKNAAEESNADKEHTAEKTITNDKSQVDKEQSKDATGSENEDKKDAAHESAGELDKEQKEEVKDSENDGKNENIDNEDKKDSKSENEEANAEGGHLKSFQLHSSSQNAFTGLAGTGFSTSSFSFGSFSNEGSGSIFGLKSDKPFGLGLSNNGSSVLGASSVSKNEGIGLAMQEVAVETGEENEEVIFNAESVLFEFVDGSWKERGKGEVKVNVASETKKARLLMRSRGNFRLILNARLYSDMKLTNMDKKGVTFACINSASEGKSGLSTFALKFKDGSIVEEFKAAVIAHKGETSTLLKTPENSPKASDD